MRPVSGLRSPANACSVRLLPAPEAPKITVRRALVHSPRALLLDEPFSALDPELRERMRAELDELLQRIDIPVLMITHDPQDLEWFGDAALYLRDGKLAEPPAALLCAPPTRLKRL